MEVNIYIGFWAFKVKVHSIWVLWTRRLSRMQGQLFSWSWVHKSFHGVAQGLWVVGCGPWPLSYHVTPFFKKLVEGALESGLSTRRWIWWTLQTHYWLQQKRHSSYDKPICCTWAGLGYCEELHHSLKNFSPRQGHFRQLLVWQTRSKNITKNASSWSSPEAKFPSVWGYPRNLIYEESP